MGVISGESYNMWTVPVIMKHVCVLWNKILRIIAGAKPRECAAPGYYDSLATMQLIDINKHLISK